MGQKIKQNCWEFKKCGREPGGKFATLGLCQATINISYDGLNGGKNGGRICWAVAGTYARNVECTCATEIFSCVTCDFFEFVQKEEGLNVVLVKRG